MTNTNIFETAARAAAEAGLVPVAFHLEKARDVLDIAADCAAFDANNAADAFTGIADMAAYRAAIELAAIVDNAEIDVADIPAPVLTALRRIDYEPANTCGTNYTPEDVETWFFESFLLDYSVLFDADGVPAAVEMDLGAYTYGGVSIVVGFCAVTVYAGGACFTLPNGGPAAFVCDQWAEYIKETAVPNYGKGC